MAADKADILLIGAAKPVIVEGLAPAVTLHKLIEAKDQDKFLADVGPRVRGIAIAYTSNKVDGPFMSRFPKLEIVSSFGVGYDHIDARWAGEHGIIVTNTPEVLNEEVADTALGLLLNTVREFPQAERYLRAGKWVEKAYRLHPPPCATAPSAWSAWAASARRSRAGSRPSACRWSITRAKPRRA